MEDLENVISCLQRQREKIALRESLFDSIVKDATEGILVFDNEHKISVLNFSCGRLFNTSPEKAESLHLADVMSTQAYEILRSALDNQPDGSLEKPLEISFSGPEGETIETLWKVRSFENLRNTTFICTIYDLTGQLLAENQLRERDELVNSLVENRYDGFLMLDNLGRIIKINRVALRLLGYEAGELLGRPIKRVVVEEYLMMPHHTLQPPYTERTERKIFGGSREVPFIRKDGKIIPLHLSSSRTRFKRQPAFCISLRDLSAQKEQENVLIEQTLRRVTAEEQNFSIIQSLRYARRIQQAMLPSPEELKTLPGSLSCFVLYKPKESLSGDFYWHGRKSGYLFMAVADCSGHGVPGGFVSLLGYTHLNYALNQCGSLSPAEILKYMDLQMNLSLGAACCESVDIALCRIHPANGELLFAGARRPLLICRSNGAFEEIKGSRTAVGHDMHGQKEFSEHSLQLQAGETIYMFSDGITDQINKDQLKYGKTRFIAFLSAIQHKSMKEQSDALDLEHFRWMLGEPQTDDLAVMGIKI